MASDKDSEFEGFNQKEILEAEGNVARQESDIEITDISSDEDDTEDLVGGIGDIWGFKWEANLRSPDVGKCTEYVGLTVQITEAMTEYDMFKLFHPVKLLC